VLARAMNLNHWIRFGNVVSGHGDRMNKQGKESK
jgi:hypothetical protein